MVDCPVCGKELTPPTIRCSICGAEVHRRCGKKLVGKWYCKGCYKEAKKEARYERMAQRSATFSGRKPGRIW